jgi:hypothetical protein
MHVYVILAEEHNPIFLSLNIINKFMKHRYFKCQYYINMFNVGTNSMADSVIIEKAIEEVETKSWGVTKQFLDIHELVFENGKPKVARVDRDKKDGTVVVYFPVRGVKFFFAVYLDLEPDVSVIWIGTEGYNSVYFRAFSETLSLEELSKLTTLKHTGGRSKGEKKRPIGGTGIVWKESTIFYEPNPEPDEFEDKLRKLLDFLETDKNGVALLVDKADGYIQVAIEFHNGNTMLGGPHIDKESIKRLAHLNLAIDFDLYESGNSFKE